MIKLDIVNAIVQKTNISRTKAEQAVETVFEAMKNALGRGERIELRRFGVFNVKPRKTGIGRNPRTGQQVSIPPGKAVRFKPGKELQALPAPPRFETLIQENKRFVSNHATIEVSAELESTPEWKCRVKSVLPLSRIVEQDRRPNIFLRRTSNSHEPRQRPQPPPD